MIKTMLYHHHGGKLLLFKIIPSQEAPVVAFIGSSFQNEWKKSVVE